MKTLHTLVLSLGMVAFANAGQVEMEAKKDTAEAPQAQSVKKEKVTLIVSGMTWGAGCPPKVQAALAKVDGVISSKVNYKKKEAVVTIDRNKLTDQELIDGLKKESGGKYTATVK